jgi:hypothetical protein
MTMTLAGSNVNAQPRRLRSVNDQEAVTAGLTTADFLRLTSSLTGRGQLATDGKPWRRSCLPCASSGERWQA